MKINEILVERVVNAFDDNNKEKYSQQVWDIMQMSYGGIPGGFGSASSIEELISKSGLWKLVVRSGKVTAANIYRDQFGRKSIASGTDGTVQGKRDYLMVKNADVKYKRAWAEVSGAPEKILARMGAKPIPSKFAELLTGKEILEYNDDNFHYTRLIAGAPHEKVIYGAVQITKQLEEYLNQKNIKLHDLPNNFKKG